MIVEKEYPAHGYARVVVKERLRQIEEEGRSPEADARDGPSSLTWAAIAYLQSSNGCIDADKFWPRHWDPAMFKPKDRRRDLVRAGALILAAIEAISSENALAAQYDDADSGPEPEIDSYGDPRVEADF